MKREILREAVELNMKRRHRKLWHRLVSGMAALVVFVTTYALILPAITMEQETVCGLQEHSHTDACWYTPVYDYGYHMACPAQLHSHESTCYGPEGALVCGYADFVVHDHDALCYAPDGQLLCTWDIRRAHTHDAACYQEVVTYQCGKEPGEGSHAHEDGCYTNALLCGLAEEEPHSHGDGCYGEPRLICGMAESDGVPAIPAHSHGESCYAQPQLLCQAGETEEHTHMDTCYAPPSLTCGLEQTEGAAEILPHHHVDACYAAPERTCVKEETEGHSHTESCYASEKQLSCGLEEQPGHVHTEECGREVQQKLVCQQEEILLHTHDETCLDENGARICGKTEILEHQHSAACIQAHAHSEACYASQEPDAPLNCGYHVHGETCLNEAGEPICTKPTLICNLLEHAHSESCYPEPEDGMAEITFVIPEELAPFVESECTFPCVCKVEEGTALAEAQGLPVLTVIQPEGEEGRFLPDHHWLASDGYPVDPALPVTQDITLTLKLYPVEEADAAKLVTASFVYDDQVLYAKTVNAGTVVSQLLTLELQQKLDEMRPSQTHFDGWFWDGETGQQPVESDITTIQSDTVYYPQFREYMAVTLYDMDPNGELYPGSPLEWKVPQGDTLAQQETAALYDGTKVTECLWFRQDGSAYDLNEPVTEPLELFTYSYNLVLNLSPEELPEEAMEETQPEETPAVLAFLPRAFALEDDPASGDSLAITKRISEPLTESDFVVDDVNLTDYQWQDDSGEDVDADDLIGTTLTSNYALTRAAATEYTITYNINVPTSGIFGTTPTIGGQSSVTDTYSSDEGSYTIRVPNPTQYMVTNGNKRQLYQFTGWKIQRNSNTVTAGEVVDAQWIKNNTNSRWSTRMTLTAQWAPVVLTETVHFFVNLNCQVADVDGNTGIPSSGEFTPSVYSTVMTVAGSSMMDYWQGPMNGSTQYVVLRADSPTQTEEIDSEIRRLITGHDSTNDTFNGNSVWHPDYDDTKIFQVDDFPSDERVLSVVRDMIRSGTVIRMNGVPISADELTSDNFTVRWNVCKYDEGDGWHIDGILVGKQAHLTVKKTFLGDEDAVEAVKQNGFTISVQGTGTAAGQNLTLTLNPAASETGTGRYGYGLYDSASDTYTWTVPLSQESLYSIIENNQKPPGDTVQVSSAYTISNSPDAFAGWKSYPESGISNVKAYAYANDVTMAGYQTVTLRNSYVKSDTLTIHKIDMNTGLGLAGVSYRLTDGEEQPFTLYQKPGASYYSMKAEDLSNGFVQRDDSVITTDSNGTIFLKLDSGTFTLEEAFPTGYGGVSKITVTVGVDSSGSVVFNEISSSDSTIEVDGTLVDKDTATLTVRNVSQPTTVTAQKVWNKASDAKPVTVELYRNGVRMGSEYQAVLNSGNSWTHTWQDLPLFADGSAAEYSLREIKIDSTSYDPSADNDGYAGYIVAYDEMVYYKNGTQVDAAVWTDSSGVTQYADNARLVVRNEVYRGQMMFLKVDGEGKPLPGATFRLYSDESKTKLVAEATSDAYGRVVFENLVPNTYYVMKESNTPEGYVGGDALYKVRLSSQGSTTLEDSATGETLTAVVNYLDEVEVGLLKVSRYGTKLSNAQFLLEIQKEGSWEEVSETATDEEGRIAFGKLNSGTYRLTETVSPDGFIKLEEPIVFALHNGELSLMNTNTLWSAHKDTDTGEYTITVLNETGYVLPRTGGVTAEAYTFGGLLLIMAALVCCLPKRRKGGTPS